MLIILTFKGQGLRILWSASMTQFKSLLHSHCKGTFVRRQIQKPSTTLHFLINFVLPSKWSVFILVCVCAVPQSCLLSRGHDRVMRITHESGTLFIDVPLLPFFSYFLTHEWSLTTRRKYEKKRGLPCFHTDWRAVEILCICDALVCFPLVPGELQRYAPQMEWLKSLGMCLLW